MKKKEPFNFFYLDPKYIRVVFLVYYCEYQLVMHVNKYSREMYNFGLQHGMAYVVVHAITLRYYCQHRGPSHLIE